MELAWQWRGYGISVRLLREHAQSRDKHHKAEESVEPVASASVPDKAHRDHLLASGSRYVGPIR